MNAIRPWKLAESNYAHLKNAKVQVAVLPFGATEPHNLHLPYGTDTYQCDAIGEAICQAAHERGARLVLLPTIPYGTETNLREFPLALNLDPSTLTAIVADLVESLVQSGVRKIVLLNGHGGNDLKPVLRELYGKSPASLFLCNWYRVLADVERQIFASPGDHAGELETSMMLAFQPHLVVRRPEGGLAADDGTLGSTRFEAIERGWVSITRPWHLLTTNTGAGNPHLATADKGRRALDLLVERLAAFLVELSNSPLDEKFPY